MQHTIQMPYDVPIITEPQTWSMYQLRTHPDRLRMAGQLIYDLSQKLHLDQRHYKTSDPRGAVSDAFVIIDEMVIQSDFNIRFKIAPVVEVFPSHDEMLLGLIKLKNELGDQIHFLRLLADQHQCIMICCTAIE